MATTNDIKDSTLELKIAILIPSVLSFSTSFILALIIVIYRRQQTLLSRFVFSMAVSDIVYTFMGVFFTFERYFERCPWFLSSIREYTRLVSCGIAISFAYATVRLTKATKNDIGAPFVKKCLIWVLLIPFVYVAIFLIFYRHEYLDVLCWYGVTTGTVQTNHVGYMLKLPLVLGFLVTFIMYSNVIIYIKRKMEQENNWQLSNKLYELLVYPLGILICYFWFFLEDFSAGYDFIRVVDIVFQQLQGFINFLIFGMNYQTRNHLKKYSQYLSNRTYEFFPFKGEGQ